MRLLRITTCKAVLGDGEGPEAARRKLRLMLLVDVYHEFDFPYEMVRAMIPALKKGGRLVFIEFRKEDPKVPIKEVHKMSEAQVKRKWRCTRNWNGWRRRPNCRSSISIIFRRK
jgi:hypothetical protein